MTDNIWPIIYAGPYYRFVWKEVRFLQVTSIVGFGDQARIQEFWWNTKPGVWESKPQRGPEDGVPQRLKDFSE